MIMKESFMSATASTANVNTSRSSQTPSPLTAAASFTNNISSNSDLDLDDSNYFSGIINQDVNPFRMNSNCNKSLSNIIGSSSLSTNFNQILIDSTNNNNDEHLLKSLNILNSAFSSSLFKNNNKSDSTGLTSTQTNEQQQSNLLHQQCGICGKCPMINGKTLVGCLHSFCQPCLMKSTCNAISNSIIACPICSQETLVPTGGIDALMPHYSNPILLNLPIYSSSSTSSTSSSSSSSSSSATTSSTSPPITNVNAVNNTRFNSKPNYSNQNYLDDLIDSSSSYDQAMLKKQQQQQLKNRLLQIENDIQKTYSFYVQQLNERRDSLIKEFHSIIQFLIKRKNRHENDIENVIDYDLFN